jgi:2-C-methyl-D-erythritol 4-phosphate cytidylyltransferase
MISVILMMAGSSSRMNLNENKLFLPLGDKLVFEHSLDLFLKNGLDVICVIKPDYIKYLTKYDGKVKIVLGGETRQQSVYNGLVACTNDYVMIHDAARPFVTQNIINECKAAIEEEKCFLVAKSSKDSVYVKTPFESIKRDNIVMAQTPQGGPKSVLLNAHVNANNDGFISTDDISLLLKYINEEIKIIDGDDSNFKITTQLDYILAKELVKL